MTMHDLNITTQEKHENWNVRRIVRTDGINKKNSVSDIKKLCVFLNQSRTEDCMQ